jgi:hypothetical protein
MAARAASGPESARSLPGSEAAGAFVLLPPQDTEGGRFVGTEALWTRPDTQSIEVEIRLAALNVVATLVSVRRDRSWLFDAVGGPTLDREGKIAQLRALEAPGP